MKKLSVYGLALVGAACASIIVPSSVVFAADTESANGSNSVQVCSEDEFNEALANDQVNYIKLCDDWSDDYGDIGSVNNINRNITVDGNNKTINALYIVNSKETVIQNIESGGLVVDTNNAKVSNSVIGSLLSGGVEESKQKLTISDSKISRVRLYGVDLILEGKISISRPKQKRSFDETDIDGPAIMLAAHDNHDLDSSLDASKATITSSVEGKYRPTILYYGVKGVAANKEVTAPANIKLNQKKDMWRLDYKYDDALSKQYAEYGGGGVMDVVLNKSAVRAKITKVGSVGPMRSISRLIYDFPMIVEKSESSEDTDALDRAQKAVQYSAYAYYIDNKYKNVDADEMNQEDISFSNIAYVRRSDQTDVPDVQYLYNVYQTTHEKEKTTSDAKNNSQDIIDAITKALASRLGNNEIKPGSASGVSRTNTQSDGVNDDVDNNVDNNTQNSKANGNVGVPNAGAKGKVLTTLAVIVLVCSSVVYVATSSKVRHILRKH